MAFKSGGEKLTFKVETQVSLDGVHGAKIRYVATAKRANIDDYNRMLADAQAMDLLGVARFTRNHLESWEKFYDVAGEPVDFSDENFEQFCSDVTLTLDFCAKYVEAFGGKNKKGNS